MYKKEFLSGVLNNITSQIDITLSPLNLKERLLINMGFIFPIQILAELYKLKFPNNPNNAIFLQQLAEAKKQFSNKIISKDFNNGDFSSVIGTFGRLMVESFGALQLANFPKLKFPLKSMGSLWHTFLDMDASKILTHMMNFCNHCLDNFPVDLIMKWAQKRADIRDFFALVKKYFPAVNITEYYSEVQNASKGVRLNINMARLSPTQREELTNIIKSISMRDEDDELVGITCGDNVIAIYEHKIDLQALQPAIQDLSSRAEVTSSTSSSSSGIAINSDPVPLFGSTPNKGAL